MSKTAFLLLLIAGFAPGIFAQNAAPNAAPASAATVNVVLADGTPVKLRLGATAAANGVRVGETIGLEVSEDVKVGDVVVVAKGSPASASSTARRLTTPVAGSGVECGTACRVGAWRSTVPRRRSTEKPIVKLVVREPESAALRRYLQGRRPLTSSALARAEVQRALLRSGRT